MKVAVKLAVVLSFLWTALAVAGEVSPWTGKPPAQSRLILESAQFAGTGTHRAGVQIKLDAGWWTYWRAPGSSGMPPVFDWSGSQNLADEPDVVWPMPLRSVAYGEELNLYKNDVVLPVEFRAADPTKPVRLHLKVTYGICRDVCIPKAAEHEITLPPAAGPLKINPATARLIAAFAGRKPSHDPSETGLQIGGVETLIDGKKGYLAIRVKGLQAKRSSLVLVEGQDLIRVAEVKPRGTADIRTKVLILKLGSAERVRDLSGKRIRVTLIDGGRALEQVWVVGAEGSSLVGVEFAPAPRRPMDPAGSWTTNLGPGAE
ncbi:MAG: protein-disulfide reductase DsbD domain-containing protein [Micropepsaceae bacterium]